MGRAEHITEQQEIDRVMQLVKQQNPTLSPAINRTWIDAWGRAEVIALYRIHPSEMCGRMTEMASAVRSDRVGMFSCITLLKPRNHSIKHRQTWKLRFNSDWQGSNDDFKNYPSTDVIAESGDYDELPCHAAGSIGSYSVLIFSQ